MDQFFLFIVFLGVVSYWPQPSLGHGRLWDPPGRSTMWQRGYHTPVNYDDDQLYCGGLQHELDVGYKCGLCGDPYDGVRENETGGKYAKGIITNTYKQGATITIQVDLTTGHQGYFEFKICSRNDVTVHETQECFDAHVLPMADGSGTRYKLPSVENIHEMVNVTVTLPSDLVCDFCVLQWRYHAGNNWGTDPNGKEGMGLGPQEEFYGCSDIKITH